MSTPLPTQTNGAGYAADAEPFKDMPQTATQSAFELRDGVVLLKGSVSRSSGSMAFPARQVCMKTGARDMEPMTFGPRGTLYSFSTVHISPNRPTPYTIGYVDFENGVRVLSVVETGPGQTLECNQTVELRAKGERWFVTPVSNKGVAA